MTSIWTAGGPAPDIGEIHRKPNLGADPRARKILASEQTEIQTQAVAQSILSPDQNLELASSEILVIGVAAVKFTAQR